MAPEEATVSYENPVAKIIALIESAEASTSILVDNYSKELLHLTLISKKNIKSYDALPPSDCYVSSTVLGIMGCPSISAVYEWSRSGREIHCNSRRDMR